MTFQFAPTVNVTTGLPDILDISVIPLASSPDAQAGATFAGGLRTVQIELTAPGPNTVTFNLIPSFSPGLSAPINYRVMWRTGVMGPTTTYDFSMVDRDTTFDDLIAGTGNIIGGETYLQQVDLGVPGRVARLDQDGNVTTSTGLVCATASEVGGVSASLSVETLAREAADAQLNTALQADIATQTSATLATAKTYTDSHISATNLDVTSERAARIAADNDLQTQVSTNHSAQAADIAANATAIGTINTTLTTKADLDGNGKVPMAQVPDAVLTHAVPATDQAAMLALSPTVVHKGDICVRPDGIFLLTTSDPSQLGNWVSLSVVSSVNSKRGAVVLNASDVGAIPTGGAIGMSQVTGLTTALTAKAAQTDMTAAQAAITAIQNDTTLVHTSAGVVPTALMSSDMVYLNSVGQLVKKDGTIIPLGSGGSGAVFSVNSKTGLVVLTAADVGAIATGGSVTQSQVTGLSTALGNKADLVSGVVSASQIPSIPESKVTGLSTDLANKADLVTGLVPLAQIPVLPQSQVTGLATLISANNLTGSSNAVNRIASLESQIVSGGGGGGGGVGTQAEFWTSANTTTAVTASDFSTVVNLHSPWGIDSDGTITGVTGTWYYLYTGVRGTDVAFPYISANGHLNLRKWNEAGAADPVYALQSTVTSLTTTVGTKANQSDLTALQSTVTTKANASDLAALSTAVDAKANTADLNALSTSVALKANQSDLTTTNNTVATKANASDLATTNTAVAAKASQTDMTAAQAAITANTSALTTKADLVSGVLKSTQIPAIPQTSVTGLSTALNAKADLVSGTVPLGQLPTNIPQSSISGLGTTLGAKADLVGGVVPVSQIPNLALPNVVQVANQAAMLALTGAQVQYGDFCVITGTSAAGTYILAGTGDPSMLANWTSISTGSAPVTSVNGYSGTVVLQASDVGALAANANIPISQVTGLTTQLSTFATTATLTSALAQKTAFSDVQAMISGSSLTKRADYVATTSISSLAGLQSVDGVLVSAGAIVLCTGQTSSVNNGLWVASTGSWSRAADYVTGSYLSKDTLVFVNNQTAGANGAASNSSIWQMQAASGFIDTAASSWTRIGWVAPQFVPAAGNGINITGSTFAAKVQTGGGIVSQSSGLARDPNVVPGKFVGTVPGGVTVAGITHNLNTTTPVVSIWDTGSNTLVLAGVTVTGANTLSIEFNSAPATGQYQVCVVG